MRLTTQEDIEALRNFVLEDVPPQHKAVATAAVNIAIDALNDLSTIANSFERIATALEQRQ